MMTTNIISTTNAAIDTPTASPTTLPSSSSPSAPAVDCLVIYSLGTISGPSSYTSTLISNNITKVYSGTPLKGTAELWIPCMYII